MLTTMTDATTPQTFRPGDPAPWFTVQTTSDSRYQLASAAGRYVVLCFFGSAGRPEAQNALRAVGAQRTAFDGERAIFVGVTVDQQDVARGRLRDMPPGIRFALDFDLAVSRLYGAVAKPAAGERLRYRPFWLVLDPMLRVLGHFTLGQAGEVLRFLESLPPVEAHAGIDMVAPILVIPRVFEPDFCHHLIGLYEAHGGEESGFMREVNGQTTLVVDHNLKRRADYTIADEATREAARSRILGRVAPEIQKAFHFRVTRMERYIVACYDGQSGGHFRAHRDNTAKGTAHRRFAVSLNLNAGEYTGGELRFPEFGPRTYTAPAGGAVVFSCSLLHEAGPVTSGKRYVFLPFLYDEEGARVREENSGALAGAVGAYRKGAALA
jgi:peroxiredoxin/predicted 2-oxoglutarate/Fe(II)-dependent dioxygenase YbiX